MKNIRDEMNKIFYLELIKRQCFSKTKTKSQLYLILFLYLELNDAKEMFFPFNSVRVVTFFAYLSNYTPSIYTSGIYIPIN